MGKGLDEQMRNGDPNLIGRFYLEYLFKTKTIASRLRLDKGTETSVMATMHAYLRQHHGDDMDPMDTVTYRPSTSNQVSPLQLCLHKHYFARTTNKIFVFVVLICV